MDEENVPFKVTWKHIDLKPDPPDEEGKGGYKGDKEDMVKFALKTAVAAFNKPENNAEKDIAAQIKKEFDKEYTPTWHCIVGSSFGSQFHYEPHKYVHFFIEKTGIILYKYG